MQNYYYEVCYFLYRHYLMLIKKHHKSMINANNYYNKGVVRSRVNGVFIIEKQYFIYALIAV